MSRGAESACGFSVAANFGNFASRYPAIICSRWIPFGAHFRWKSCREIVNSSSGNWPADRSIGMRFRLPFRPFFVFAHTFWPGASSQNPQPRASDLAAKNLQIPDQWPKPKPRIQRPRIIAEAKAPPRQPCNVIAQASNDATI